MEIVVYHTGARFQATVLRDAAHQVVTTDVGGAQRAAQRVEAADAERVPGEMVPHGRLYAMRRGVLAYQRVVFVAFVDVFHDHVELREFVAPVELRLANGDVLIEAEPFP